MRAVKTWMATEIDLAAERMRTVPPGFPSKKPTTYSKEDLRSINSLIKFEDVT